MFNRIPARYRPLAILGGIVVLVGFWYLFRPELLFVPKHVDEPLPGATSALSLPQVAYMHQQKNIIVRV